MGMSAWGLLAAPFLAQAPAPEAGAPESELAGRHAAIVADDVFGGLAALDETVMRNAAGGANVAVDIGVIAANIGENNGDVKNTYTNGNTGQIANNSVNGNGGITTVFNNTGNGVVFQSIVNVNIFMNAAGSN